MTVKYNYECSSCNYKYIEQRAASESQFITICVQCETGTFVETSVEVISETIERVAAPEVITEETE